MESDSLAVPHIGGSDGVLYKPRRLPCGLHAECGPDRGLLDHGSPDRSTADRSMWDAWTTVASSIKSIKESST
jgi:hypothetical protein